MNRGLFGTGSQRRRVRESDASDDARGHMCDAMHAAVKSGDHDLAEKIHGQIREQDEALEESDEGDEDLDQSQAGRGKPTKDPRAINTGNSGLPNMESRQRRRGQGRPMTEAQLKSWAANLLRPDGAVPLRG
jgi:hypothetical protein